MQGSNGFRLSEPVGWYGANKRLDVAKVKNLLGMTGYLELGVTDGTTGYFGTRMDQAIKGFQKSYGLKVDGRANPGGETINALKGVAKSEGDCPDGYHETMERVCIPLTKICWYVRKCVPYPAGGGIRG